MHIICTTSFTAVVRGLLLRSHHSARSREVEKKLFYQQFLHVSWLSSWWTVPIFGKLDRLGEKTWYDIYVHSTQMFYETADLTLIAKEKILDALCTYYGLSPCMSRTQLLIIFPKHPPASDMCSKKQWTAKVFEFNKRGNIQAHRLKYFSQFELHARRSLKLVEASQWIRYIEYKAL